MPSNKDVVQELQEILRSWEDSQSVTTNDPTEHLVKLCELFERETVNFLKQVSLYSHKDISYYSF